MSGPEPATAFPPWELHNNLFRFHGLDLQIFNREDGEWVVVSQHFTAFEVSDILADALRLLSSSRAALAAKARERAAIRFEAFKDAATRVSELAGPSNQLEIGQAVDLLIRMADDERNQMGGT